MILRPPSPPLPSSSSSSDLHQHHLDLIIQPEQQTDHHLQPIQAGDEEEEEREQEESNYYSFHIEVNLRSNSTILADTVRQAIGHYIIDNFTTLQPHTFLPGWSEIKFLANDIQSVYCAESGYPSSLIPVQSVNLHIHVYELPPKDQDSISMLYVNPLGSSSSSELLDHDTHEADDHESSATGDVAASRIRLPANRYQGIWESLIYEEGLKTRLLNYIYSSIIFAEHNVDRNLVNWHRLVLLHGPPGTGKTSLCKSLAQKVAIRLSGLYHETELVEINSHSLFSKWFSESGKLVNNLFSKIEQIAENPNVFVLVLMDEVESLAGSRSSGATGNDPSDALRAVNSLLTALDKLKEHKNVLVLTTSNLTGSIDEAFLDRADLKQYIGLPSPEAIYWILKTCLLELMQAQILTRRRILDYKEAVMIREELGESQDNGIHDDDDNDDRRRKTTTSCRPNSSPRFSTTSLLDHFGPKLPPSSSSSSSSLSHQAQRIRKSSLKLLEISQRAAGMSGRSLRRLPLLAHASTPVARSSLFGRQQPCKLSIDSYLVGMLEVVQKDFDLHIQSTRESNPPRP